jgi:hypothetical protein
VKLKMYQIHALCALALAVLFTFTRYEGRGASYTGLASALEAMTFAFSISATLLGGRSVRRQFVALGSDKSVARATPAYMRDRRELQLNLIAPVTAVAVLLAARYGLNLLLTWLLVPVGLGVVTLLVNRLAGWTVKK